MPIRPPKWSISCCSVLHAGPVALVALRRRGCAPSADTNGSGTVAARADLLGRDCGLLALLVGRLKHLDHFLEVDEFAPETPDTKRNA